MAQDRFALSSFFHEDASIRRHCSNEQFTVAEYVRANCDYPGTWEGELERVGGSGQSDNPGGARFFKG